MATRQYIGARYVPKFYENSQNTSEWQAGVMYEPLTIVTYNGNSYTSKKPVPSTVGNPSVNPTYWVATGIFNEQLQDVSNRVSDIENALDDIDDDITALEGKTKWYTPEMYGAAGDGVTDDTAAFNAMFGDIPNDSLILLESKVYLISDTVTINKVNLRISGICRSEFYPTIKTTKTSGTSILVLGSGCSFNDVLFQGNTSSNTSLVLVELNADNSTLDGNADGEFRNCGFFNAYIGVQVKGRNVRCTNCIFSTLTIGYQTVQTAIDTDNRGYVITNNRFHSVVTCINNTVSNTRTMKNFIISGNFADICVTFFAGKGGGLVITDNTISTEGYQTSANIIVIQADALNSNSILNIVSNNNILGKDYGASGSFAIFLESGRAIIEGNKIQRVGGSGIACSPNTFAIIKNNVLVDVAKNQNYAIQCGAGNTGVIKYNTLYNCTHTTIVAPDMTVDDNDVISV